MLAIIGAIIGVLGALAAGAAAFFKITRHLTRIESKVDQSAYLTAYVPQLWNDVETIKKHLDISTPTMPMFVNHDHDAEE